MNNLNLSVDEKKELNSLYRDYSNRKALTKTKIAKYYEIAKNLTKRIME